MHTHTHTHTLSHSYKVFATHMAPGVADPTSFFFFFKNKPIVLFKSFQPDLQIIASSSVSDCSRLCHKNHKIISFTSAVASHLTNQVAALGTTFYYQNTVSQYGKISKKAFKSHLQHIISGLQVQECTCSHVAVIYQFQIFFYMSHWIQCEYSQDIL